MAAAALLAGLSPAGAGAEVPILSISGKGFGHGVGMAQDGAYWMGRQGATTPQILGQFYPGTAIGRAIGQVRVSLLATSTPDTDLVFPTGGQVRDSPAQAQSPGFPVAVPARATAHVHFDGSRYSVTVSTASAVGPRGPRRGGGGGGQLAMGAAQAPLPTLPSPSSTAPTSPATTAPVAAPTTTTAPPARPTTTSTAAPAPGSSTTTTTGVPAVSSTRPLWAIGNGANGLVGIGGTPQRFRGVMETVADQSPAGAPVLRLVNQLDVEQYLRGMGEVLAPAWPPASLRTQAIAARTYAMRAIAAGGEICPDTRCQVYLGQQVEYPAMDKAVADTAGQVLFYGGQLASTVYSANGGGYSASRAEGFGAEGATFAAAYPYLRAAPYPTNDPLPWTVQVALTDVAARLAYHGTITGVTVSQAGPSGRALVVSLDGSAGRVGVTGLQMAAAFGLRSTLFSTTVAATAAAPPPPPPPAAPAVQAPPDAAAAITAAAASPAAPPDPAPVTATAKQAGTSGRHRGQAGLYLLGVLTVLNMGAGAAWTLWRRGLFDRLR